MSTMVPMPGAGEAAAGRDRRDHLARLRVLRDRHAAERRAHHHVGEVGLLQVDLAFGHADLLLRVGDAGLERVHFRLRLVELGLADDLLLQQLLPPARASVPPAAGAPGLPRSSCAPRPSCASAKASWARGCESSRWARICPSFDRPDPLRSGRSTHLAGHLRRHRRAAPRRDVARRVQDRTRRRRAAVFAVPGHLDGRRLQRGGPVPAAASRARRGRGGRRRHQRLRRVRRRAPPG